MSRDEKQDKLVGLIGSMSHRLDNINFFLDCVKGHLPTMAREIAENYITSNRQLRNLASELTKE
jgi:hypothetical protein